MNNYTSQVNMYREMLEAMHPELKGCCGGLGILQLSTFYGTPKNLRFNGEDGVIVYTADNTKQLQADGKPIEVHKEYKAPRFPEGNVQKAVITVEESTPEQYYKDKRHKPLTISTLDTYRSSKKSKV